MKLPELFGSTEILGEARALTDNERALAAIDRLENVYGILEIYGLSSYVTFDLGMLSKYQYYTGIILKATPTAPAITLSTGAATTSCWCSLERMPRPWASPSAWTIF